MVSSIPNELGTLAEYLDRRLAEGKNVHLSSPSIEIALRALRMLQTTEYRIEEIALDGSAETLAVVTREPLRSTYARSVRLASFELELEMKRCDVDRISAFVSKRHASLPLFLLCVSVSPAAVVRKGLGDGPQRLQKLARQGRRKIYAVAPSGGLLKTCNEFPQIFCADQAQPDGTTENGTCIVAVFHGKSN
jgi:hypothetical protein